MSVRSVLWIGPADRMEESPILGLPRVDLAWSRDLDDALALPLDRFDSIVLDAGQGAEPAGAQALRAEGARDVIVTDAPARYPTVEDLAPGRRVREEAPPPKGLIGRSVAMRRTFALVERACQTEATVLLQGETGTGKELLARAVHDGGARSARSFVAVNCAAFPDTLLESELFGHVRGAFTGADRTREGLFVAAEGGTLFLDEIGETSGPFQAKLLRVLQEREVRPVGGTRARGIDVRVVAATHRELRKEVSRGHFREDLFYRLSVFPIAVPPLRERLEDVPLLAQHFLEEHGRRESKRGCQLSQEALRLLLSHRWPGNVRELENEIQRALALSRAGELLPPDRFSPDIEYVVEPTHAVVRDGEPLRDSMARIESWLLRQALERHGGRRAETARALGITREGLYKKLKRLGIE
ncbi:MAG: sigma 54-interacting transcriptional regulator [Myxococcota bacterium]|nr:sigma 54-interacting transcriptional regulator [Myxococcota bacterium]